MACAEEECPELGELVAAQGLVALAKPTAVLDEVPSWADEPDRLELFGTFYSVRWFLFS